MKIKHISSTGGRSNRTWHYNMINVEKVKMEDTVKGELVYIAGDLVHDTPTSVYGPHRVEDVATCMLINRKGRTFYERMDVYREVKG
jgi:hypothetical protein